MRFFRQLKLFLKTILRSKTKPPIKLRSQGVGVVFDKPVTIYHAHRVSLGNYVYIGPGTKLYGRGGLEISDHVIIAPDVILLTSMHNYKNASLIPFDQVQLLKPVKIERGVWIGTRAIIMPGVSIGEGSIIGAGAVVTKSCPPGTILAGNPATSIGQRDMTAFYKCVENNQFYLLTKQTQNLQKTEQIANTNPQEFDLN
jgi:acetyltransferase-like isoleucine patch superfamily enzyme